MAANQISTTCVPAAIKPREFYVYTHARPDGSVFYVGKGYGRRAWDFSPSRRTAWHRNIAEKHGLANIIVTIYPSLSEEDAFYEERRMIALLRASSICLINLTDGGEGAAGRRVTSDAHKAALALGRGKSVVRSPGWFEAFQAGGRKAKKAWHASDAGRAADKLLSGYSRAAYAARIKWPIVCLVCQKVHMTRDNRTKVCSKRCEQRLRRSKERAALPPRIPKLQALNTSGVTGVYWNRLSKKWIANISISGKLVHLGSFVLKDDAIRARHDATMSKGVNDNRHSDGEGLSAAS